MRLIPDTPITEDGEDLIGFGSYVEQVGSLIRNADSADSCSIGLYADWGRGKTSFINLLQEYLQKDANIICVYFQAWRFDSEKYPMASLLATLLDKVEDKVSRQVIKHLRTVLKHTEPFCRFSFLGMLGLKINLKAIFSDSDTSIERFKQVEKVKDGLEGKKIVIFIDDLDRCQPDIVVRFLEGVKQIFDLPGYSVVMGLNRHVLNRFIIQKFESLGVSNLSVDRYLEKLFKIEFELVKTIQPDIDKFIKNLFKKYIYKHYSDNREFESLEEIIGLASRENPRAAIKLINKLILIVESEISYDKEQKSNSLSEEIFQEIEKKCFEECLSYISPIIFKELFHSSISRDVFVTLLCGSRYPEPYLVDFLVCFAEENEAKTAVKLLLHDIGKIWICDKNEKEEAGEQTFLLKEKNLKRKKIQQYLLDTIEPYANLQRFEKKIFSPEKKQLLSDYNFSADNYGPNQLQGILKCLVKNKLAEPLASFYIKFIQHIFATYFDEDIFPGNSEVTFPLKLNADKESFNHCLRLLLQVINLDTNNDLTIRALLIYSAIFERKSLHFYLDNVNFQKEKDSESEKTTVYEFLNNCGEHIGNEIFYTCEDLMNAAKENGYPVDKLDEKNFQQIYHSGYNVKQNKDEKIAELLNILERGYQKLLWDNSESTNLFLLLVNMTSLASSYDEGIKKAEDYYNILEELLLTQSIQRMTYMPYLQTLRKKIREQQKRREQRKQIKDFVEEKLLT